MLTPPFVKHTVAFTTNSVPHIITPPLLKTTRRGGTRRSPVGIAPLGKLESADARPFDPSTTLRASFFAQGRICAATSFTNVIYTKLSTFPSRKMLTFRRISCSLFLRLYFMALIKKSCDTDRRGLGIIQNLKIITESFRIPDYEMLVVPPDRLSCHYKYS